MGHGVGVGGGHAVARSGRSGVGRVLVAPGGELAGVGGGVVDVLGGGGSGGRAAGRGEGVGGYGGQHTLGRQVGGRVHVLRRVSATHIHNRVNHEATRGHLTSLQTALHL